MTLPGFFHNLGISLVILGVVPWALLILGSSWLVLRRRVARKEAALAAKRAGKPPRLTRYRALRRLVRVDPLTAGIIAAMNAIAGIPEGQIRVMTVIIDYDPLDPNRD